MAIGLPLLARCGNLGAHAARSAAAAAVPVLALCAALTQSAGVGRSGRGVAVFVGFAPQRATKLITCAITACGGALLVAYGLHRNAIKSNLGGSHSHQAWMVALATVVICACVGLAHAGADRVMARITLPRLLSPTPRQARIALAAAVLVLVVAGLVAHGPSHISHAWNSFKSASGADATNHFATSSGEGRYQFWVAKSTPPSAPHRLRPRHLPAGLASARGDPGLHDQRALALRRDLHRARAGRLPAAVGIPRPAALVVLIRQAVRSRAEDRVRACRPRRP